MKELGIPFEEELIRFLAPDFKTRVRSYSASGKVPLLVEGPLVVWDSLAIVETLAERFPGVWPASPVERARARSACAEMHSGFSALRQSLPMNATARFPAPLLTNATRADVARILSLWSELRERADGPFLFGKFSAADAYFAPVALRFVTYNLALPSVAADYTAEILRLPSMKHWLEAAEAEDEFVAQDEPFREAPGTGRGD